MSKYKELEKRIEWLEGRYTYLRDLTNDLWNRHQRLLDYLELEDVVIPSDKVIRKKKP